MSDPQFVEPDSRIEYYLQTHELERAQSEMNRLSSEGWEVSDPERKVTDESFKEELWIVRAERSHCFCVNCRPAVSPGVEDRLMEIVKAKLAEIDLAPARARRRKRSS
jgi:hypothetical protein